MKLSIRHIIKLLLFLFILSSSVYSQQTEEEQNPESQDSVFVMQKSPWGAVLRSAVFPGWGQLYNQSYYKAPIIWGLGAWLVYYWIQYDDDYKLYAELYNQNTGSGFERSNQLRLRDYNRDQRDLFSLYIALVYFLNLVDAYVDAHLFDFTVEEDFLTRYPMIGIKIPF